MKNEELDNEIATSNCCGAKPLGEMDCNPRTGIRLGFCSMCREGAVFQTDAEHALEFATEEEEQEFKY